MGQEYVINLLEELAPLLGVLGVALCMAAILALIVSARQTAGKLFWLGLISIVVRYLIPSMAREIPVWIILAVLALMGLAMLGSFVAVFIGKDAANTMVGGLAADVVRGVFKVMILPLKALKRLFGSSDGS